MSEEDEKYRSIFEYSPVPLWEEDVSRLRSKLKDLKTGGSTNLRAHLAAHPEFVQEAARQIEVTDVNEASLRLFEADHKEQLLGPLDAVLDAVSRAALTETVLAIDEGRGDIEVESSAQTLKGRKLCLVVKSHIPPAGADEHEGVGVDLQGCAAMRNGGGGRLVTSLSPVTNIVDLRP